MARYFDVANPTFRNQALAILMLILLGVALLAARGSMAYRRALRGPWYKTLLPSGAMATRLPVANALPSDAATYIWHQPGHHHIMLAFFNATRESIVGSGSTTVHASPFIRQLFPHSHGWATPKPAIESFMGIPLLIWRSHRVATHTPAAAPGKPPIDGIRFLMARSIGGGRFHVVVFGYGHSLSVYDKEIFLSVAARLAHQNP